MPEQPRDTHRSFTVRTPISLYVEMGDLARQDGVHLNKKVNELLRLGLKRHLDLNEAIGHFLKREIIGEATHG